MRTSRNTRKLIGAISAAAVSALLLGGTAAVTMGDSAGHGMRYDRTYSAGHGLQASTRDGHGL